MLNDEIKRKNQLKKDIKTHKSTYTNLLNLPSELLDWYNFIKNKLKKLRSSIFNRSDIKVEIKKKQIHETKITEKNKIKENHEVQFLDIIILKYKIEKNLNKKKIELLEVEIEKIFN